MLKETWEADRRSSESHRPRTGDAGEDGQHGGAGAGEPPGGPAEAEEVV